MSDDVCTRKGKWIRGCRFEARYDAYAPSRVLENQLSQQWAMSESDKDLLVERRIYVHDVCVTCGKVVAPCLDD
jgi:hypothetical protein